MTECPACYRDTMGPDGKCTRCGVQLPKAHPMVDTVGRAQRRRRPDQDNTSAFTDLARYKEDHT